MDINVRNIIENSINNQKRGLEDLPFEVEDAIWRVVRDITVHYKEELKMVIF